MKVELAIEHLMLEGYPDSDTAAVGPRLAAELERLLAQQGVPPGLREGRALPALSLDGAPPPGAGPVALARGLAAAIYGGLGGRTS